jgi:diadenosine tetraphosphate (Ap4A) HIT family hydrolase
MTEKEQCIFCDPDAASVVLENDKAYARHDAYPVSPGHLLVIPKRHVASLFDTTPEELADLWELVGMAKEFLDAEYRPDGYNIGVNVGRAAGQSVIHLHVHVIPRYAGDMDEPKGGVRGVIPERQRY